MKVNPVSHVKPMRHVHFSDVVEVRIQTPEESHPIQPTIEAQRIETAVRATPNVQGVAAVENNRAMQDATKCWKSSCHTVSLFCGLAILPSFALVALGPFGLLAPACLALAFITLALLGGKPSEVIQATRDKRAAEVANSDNRTMT